MIAAIEATSSPITHGISDAADSPVWGEAAEAVKGRHVINAKQLNWVKTFFLIFFPSCSFVFSMNLYIIIRNFEKYNHFHKILENHLVSCRKTVV